MKLLYKIENWILWFGIVLCCLGLFYILGYSKHIVFKYAFGIGFIMIAISILFSLISKKE